MTDLSDSLGVLILVTFDLEFGMHGMDVTETWPEPAQPGVRRSVVASDLIVDGDITSKGPVDVQGRVRGQIMAPEVIVASPGGLEGTIVALTLTIQGAVSGRIAAKHVSLASSAVVQADITHGMIEIAAGAQVEGALRRKP